MPQLDPTILAAVEEVDRTQKLREDLEDTIKEYGELDVLIELLQNALDTLDERRYRQICQASGRDPLDEDTVTRWNAAVLQAINADSHDYIECGTDNARVAVYYAQCLRTEERRRSWWEILGQRFDKDPPELARASMLVDPVLKVTVRLGPPHWLEVEDSGLGMEDVLASFRHQNSLKRPSQQRKRRLGVRGSHGWGLSAVLAYSDRIEVASRVGGGEPAAYTFSGYAAFARGDQHQPQNEQLDALDGFPFSERLIGGRDAVGTHIRVQLARVDRTNVLGSCVTNFSPAKFTNLLRLYTPIGQLNDYVFHPAFHTVRKDDLSIGVDVFRGGERTSQVIPFDTFRLDEWRPRNHYAFDAYVNAGMPRGVSVHTVHRVNRGGHHYLTGADIQEARFIRDLEAELIRSDALPDFVNDQEVLEAEIPRGFVLALSGGMRSEFFARPVRGNTANFRGTVLAETAPPTLGRKYVVDQRLAIARAAQDHESRYDDVRRHTLPAREPAAGTPRQGRWRRDYLQNALDEMLAEPPLSQDLRTWGARGSREARVMLVFAELLARGFEDLRVLRINLRDIYDFSFWQQARVEADSVPSLGVARQLGDAGFASFNARSGQFDRYGIGEFKAEGESILDDFAAAAGIKHPDTPDLVVCWEFSSDILEDRGWAVNDVTADEQEFRLQTHIWLPADNKIDRKRPLPVVALGETIKRLVRGGRLAEPPAPWPDLLPGNYY